MFPALQMAQKDYLEQLLQVVVQRLDRLESKVDTNTSLTQQALLEAEHTNGRITAAEKVIRKLELKKGKKLDLSPNVIYLIALGAVILLIMVASVLKINLGGIVK